MSNYCITPIYYPGISLVSWEQSLPPRVLLQNLKRYKILQECSCFAYTSAGNVKQSLQQCAAKKPDIILAVNAKDSKIRFCRFPGIILHLQKAWEHSSAKKRDSAGTRAVAQGKGSSNPGACGHFPSKLCLCKESELMDFLRAHIPKG